MVTGVCKSFTILSMAFNCSSLLIKYTAV